MSYFVMHAIAAHKPGEWTQGSIRIDPDIDGRLAWKFRVNDVPSFGGYSKQETSGEDHSTRTTYQPPLGYSLIKLYTGDVSNGIEDVVVFGVLDLQDFLKKAKSIRREMPHLPGSRFSRDEVYCCTSCAMQVMARGGDNAGWKGIQMTPNDASSMSWFCPNQPCVDAYNAAVQTAGENWA